MQELTNSYHWKLTPLPRIISTMNKYMDTTLNKKKKFTTADMVWYDCA